MAEEDVLLHGVEVGRGLARLLERPGVERRALWGRIGQVVTVSLMAAGMVGLVAHSRHSRRPSLKASSYRSFAQLDSTSECSEGTDNCNATKCSEGTDNCNATKCCSSPGLQCYEQSAAYAQCRASCIPGPDPTHWDGMHWTCKELGERTPGEVSCGVPGQDCRTSRCCKDIGYTCFEKNESWATCKSECIAGGPDLSDKDNYPWTCKELGVITPGLQGWVQAECATGWDSCIDKKCCKNIGEQCYKQNDYFGTCKSNCDTFGWSCETLGTKTPGGPAKAGGKTSPWVTENCSLPYQGCQESRCCIGMEVQCYEKDENWAQCRESCTKGTDPADVDNATWSCKELGPRSYGLALKGSPSLFCFSLLRTVGYEVGLMEAQLDHGTGIFACDHSALLTADGQITLGKGNDSVTSIEFHGAVVGTSMDGTAGNTALFVAAWNAVIHDGNWKNYSWTVKADPDAVLLPDRLRWHLADHTGENVFVVNCNKFPGSPNYPMMYGALEVFSYAAMQAWEARGNTCYAPAEWGEDYYMTHCMDYLGVGRVLDETVLGDNLCKGADCANGWPAAFHPFKNFGAWMECYNQAVNTSRQ